MRLYYAQNKEDLFIQSFFPDVKKGFYIDVGANDPVLDSVTKILYDKGWHGVNIEPIQKHFDALKSQRPKDITLQIGLSDKPGTLTFTEYPEADGLSTFDASMRDFYEEGNHEFSTKNFRKYDLEAWTLQQVIDEVKPKHVHFIKIDVEGYEYEVIRGYDWKKIRPELICIEANHIHNDWRPLLEKNKYHKVFFDGVNDYYLSEESLFRKEYFNYPNTAFAGNPVYHPAYLEMESRADQKVAEVQKVVSEKERDMAFLHQQQRDVRFLAKRLAAEVQIRLNKRAKGIDTSRHLGYRSDEKVALLAEKQVDKKQLLEEVHKLDSSNVYKKHTRLIDRIKPIGWRLASAILDTTIKVIKKTRHAK